MYNTYEPYRPCPICRGRLHFMRKQRENGIEWDVYICTGDSQSEVWVDPYKGRRKKGWLRW
jgi:hypothetical protein